jgi:hypothetical protein
MRGSWEEPSMAHSISMGRGKTYYVYIIFNIETGFNVAHLLGGMLGETLTCEESIWPHQTMIQ